MIFSEPVSFVEAIASREVKTILGTTLGTEDLSKIAPEIRERAMFSARTTNEGYLRKINDQIKDLVDGKKDQASVRLELKKSLEELDYRPDAEDRGGIQDLSSDRRLNLVIETNARQAQGYGYWEQGQDEDLLRAFPAQELVRVEERNMHRDWESRWEEAGGEFYDGRMIAPKNDPIWTDISAFGTPYEPFDFGSGMGTRDISRREAIELGVIDADTEIDPQSRGFNEDLEIPAGERDDALFEALRETLGAGFELVKGMLRAKA